LKAKSITLRRNLRSSHRATSATTAIRMNAIRKPPSWLAPSCSTAQVAQGRASFQPASKAISTAAMRDSSPESPRLSPPSAPMSRMTATTASMALNAGRSTMV
jgi:hypothetical protein